MDEYNDETLYSENENLIINQDDTEVSGCGATACCDPRRPLHRYIILFFLCFLSFGSYFCFDNPGALQDNILHDMDINSGQYMELYAFYSWPNVILSFFGGFLIDKVLGVRLGAIIFSLFVLCGQIVFALGGFLGKFWLMEAGRFIFGIGGESLCVAQNTYAVSWFKGKELNMVFGLQLSFSRVGSTVNFNVMQPLYEFLGQWFDGYENLGMTLFCGVLFCCLSLTMALVLAYFDRRAKRILQEDKAKTGEVVKITDVRYFPAEFWLLCIICVTYYVAVFVFVGLGLVFFEMKFQLPPSLADNVNSLVFIVSAVASPVFGFLIDRTGKNIFWINLGILITIGCHALLCFTFINPYAAMIIMGFAYSILASALWPLVSHVVPAHQLGTAYGLMQSFQNLGLAVVAVMGGAIVDHYGYLMLEIQFLLWLCLSLMTGLSLYLLDASKGGVLNLSASERAKKAIQMKIEEISSSHD